MQTPKQSTMGLRLSEPKVHRSLARNWFLIRTYQFNCEIASLPVARIQADWVQSGDGVRVGAKQKFYTLSLTTHTRQVKGSKACVNSVVVLATRFGLTASSGERLKNTSISTVVIEHTDRQTDWWLNPPRRGGSIIVVKRKRMDQKAVKTQPKAWTNHVSDRKEKGMLGLIAVPSVTHAVF